MSDKHPNPHQQQAPVHDSEEAQPGLDSLAPDDREWRPRRNLPLRASNPPPRQPESARYS